MTRLKSGLALFALAALAAGCFNIQRDYQDKFYYQMEYTAPQIGGESFPGVVVRMGGFQVAPSYQSQKIIYSTSVLKRKAYEYHLWIVNPGDMFGDLLVRDMIDSARYAAVVDVRSSVNPQYEIEGIIEEIYEKDEQDTWQSVLQVRVIFMAVEGMKKRVLFQKVYREGEPTGSHTPEAVVSAMSRAAQNISSRVQKDVQAAVGVNEAKKAAEAAAPAS
jgi:ABC-type uncharacterized transport system auxiliary subunit